MTTRTARTELRRAEILDAAVRCFSEHGVEATTIDMICNRSGASVGSLYHHFGDKLGVAAALAIEGITRYQRGLFDLLAADLPPGHAIEAMVRHHVSWIRDHADWAMFLFTQFRAATRDVRGEVEAINRQLFEALGEWIDRHASAGRLAPLSPRVFLAVVLGPIHELSRSFVEHGNDSDLETLTDQLASAASRAAGAGAP